MKKAALFVLVSAMCIVLCACGSSAPEVQETQPLTTQTPATETAPPAPVQSTSAPDDIAPKPELKPLTPADNDNNEILPPVETQVTPPDPKPIPSEGSNDETIPTPPKPVSSSGNLTVY